MMSVDKSTEAQSLREELSAAIRAGDIDAACAAAKQVADYAETPAEYRGKMAMVVLVKAVEYMILSEGTA